MWAGRWALLGTALLACERAEEPVSRGARELVASIAPPVPEVMPIRFGTCHGCDCCSQGRILPGRHPSAACADCALHHALLAHGVSFEGAMRFQVGVGSSVPFFRLPSGAKVRLKLPPGTAVFGVTADEDRHTDCELSITGFHRSWYGTAQFSLEHRDLFVGEPNGEVIQSVELELDCKRERAEAAIEALWLYPPPAVSWPTLPETPRTSPRTPTEPAVADRQGLVWNPPLLLEGDDPKQIALEVMASALVRRHFQLGEGHAFAVRQVLPSRVDLDHRYRWRGQELEVVHSGVTLELADGNRLVRIDQHLQSWFTLPDRDPLPFERAAAKARMLVPRASPPLAVRQGELVYVFSAPCTAIYVGAFDGRERARRPLCIQ